MSADWSKNVFNSNVLYLMDHIHCVLPVIVSVINDIWILPAKVSYCPQGRPKEFEIGSVFVANAWILWGVGGG